MFRDVQKCTSFLVASYYNKRNHFDIEKFLNHKLILRADDEYEVIEVTEN